MVVPKKPAKIEKTLRHLLFVLQRLFAVNRYAKSLFQWPPDTGKVFLFSPS